MTPDAKLESLLKSATPPARDLAFEAEVARRVALRRAWLGVAAMVPWTLAGAMLLWAIARTAGPGLAFAAEALEPAAMVLTAAAAGAGLLLWMVRRLDLSAT